MRVSQFQSRSTGWEESCPVEDVWGDEHREREDEVGVQLHVRFCQTQPKLLQILRRINVNCRINVNTIDSNDHGVGDNVYVTKM